VASGWLLVVFSVWWAALGRTLAATSGHERQQGFAWNHQEHLLAKIDQETLMISSVTQLQDSKNVHFITVLNTGPNVGQPAMGKIEPQFGLT